MKITIVFILTALFSCHVYSQSLEAFGLFGSHLDTERIGMIKIDSEKSIIISGYMSDTLNNPFFFVCEGTYIAKIDTNNNVVWAHSMKDTFYPPVLSIDSNDNIFASGIYYDTLTVGSLALLGDTSIENNFLIKMNKNGTILWGTKITNNTLISDMVLDHNGDLILAGSTRGISPFSTDTIISYGGGLKPDIILAKFDSTGNFIWATHAGNAGFYSDNAFDVAVDNNNNIFVGGNFRGDAFFDTISLVPINTWGFTGFAAKYSPSGVVQWAKITNRTSEGIPAIATDSYGNCYIGGESVQDLDVDTASFVLNSNCFWAKLDPNGNHIWTITDEDLYSVFLDGVHDFVIKDDLLYSCGTYTDSLIINSNLLGVSSTCDSNKRNSFILCMDLNGNILWHKFMSSCYGISEAFSIDINNCGIAVGGQIGATDTNLVYFENDSISSDQRDGMYYRLEWPGCSPTSISEQTENEINIYPNPSDKVIYLNKFNKISQIIIIDSRGKIIEATNGPTNKIDISNLKNGIYFLRVISDSKSKAFKFIKH